MIRRELGARGLVLVGAEEHEDIKRIRHRAADLSMGFGVIAVLTAILSRQASPILPGCVLLGIGGLVAIGVYAAPDLTMSRWFTLWSAVLTAIGVVALIVVSQLAD